MGCVTFIASHVFVAILFSTTVWETLIKTCKQKNGSHQTQLLTYPSATNGNLFPTHSTGNHFPTTFPKDLFFFLAGNTRDLSIVTRLLWVMCNSLCSCMPKSGGSTCIVLQRLLWYVVMVEPWFEDMPCPPAPDRTVPTTSQDMLMCFAWHAQTLCYAYYKRQKLRAHPSFFTHGWDPTLCHYIFSGPASLLTALNVQVWELCQIQSNWKP